MSSLTFGPHFDWSLPEDWRDVAGISEIALSYLHNYLHADESEELSLQQLSDVIGAANLILQVPLSLRGSSFLEFNQALQRSTAPRLKKMQTLVGLWANPIGTAVGLLGFASHRIEHNEIDFIEIMARTTREQAVYTQIERCLISNPQQLGDERFEVELGQAVYWFAFQEVEHWEIKQNLRLSPDLANDAIKRHKQSRKREYENPRFKFDLWVNSPSCKKQVEEMGKMNFYIKKMSKGRKFSKIERAWSEYVKQIESRHRYVYLYAERSKWERI